MGQRILFFESDPSFGSQVKSYFEKWGADLTIASDGTLGLELAEAQPPDLILLTIELLGMNGFVVCKRLKKHERLSKVPLVILSSDATADTFEQHKKLRMRADEYIHKPVSPQTLKNRVQRLLSGRADGALPANLGGTPANEVGGSSSVGQSSASSPPAQSEKIAPAAANQFADEAIDSLLVEPSAYEVTHASDLNGSGAPTTAYSGLDERATPNMAPPSRSAAPLIAAVPRRSSAPPAYTGAGAREQEQAWEPGDLRRSQMPRRPSAEGSAANAAELEAARAQVRELADKLAEVEAEAASRATDARARLDALEDARAQAERRADAAEASAAAAQRASHTGGAGAAGQSGAVSSRDFLALREQLIRKDRELLSLRSEISERDQQILEANDRSLGLERELADISDEVAEVQQSFDQQREEVQALIRERDPYQRREQELGDRLEELYEQLRQSDDERQVAVTELSAMRTRYQEDVAQLQEEAEAGREQLEQERAAAQTQLAHSRERLKESERSGAAYLSELHRVKELLEDTRRELAGEQQQAQQVAQERDGLALALQQSEAQQQELQGRHVQEIERLAREHALHIQRAREEAASAREQALQSEFAERSAHLADEHQLELTRLREEMVAETSALQDESDRYAHEAEEARNQAAGLKRRLEEAEGARSALATTLSRSQDEAERARESEAVLREELSQLSSQVAHDAEVVERVRRAMAIGLGLLDERPPGG